MSAEQQVLLRILADARATVHSKKQDVLFFADVRHSLLILAYAIFAAIGGVVLAVSYRYDRAAAWIGLLALFGAATWIVTAVAITLRIIGTGWPGRAHETAVQRLVAWARYARGVDAEPPDPLLLQSTKSNNSDENEDENEDDGVREDLDRAVDAIFEKYQIEDGPEVELVQVRRGKRVRAEPVVQTRRKRKARAK